MILTSILSAFEADGSQRAITRYPYPDLDISVVDGFSPPAGFIKNILIILIKVCDEVETCVEFQDIEIISKMPPPPAGI